MSFASTLCSDDDVIMIISMFSQDGINPTLSVGQWYLVNYEGTIFLGEVCGY